MVTDRQVSILLLALKLLEDSAWRGGDRVLSYEVRDLRERLDDFRFLDGGAGSGGSSCRGLSERTLSTGEAAELLGLTDRTIRYRIKHGQLAAEVVNGAYRIDIDEIVRARRQAA